MIVTAMLLVLCACAAPHADLCCVGFTDRTSGVPPLGLANELPAIRETVRKKTKDGFVGEIRWIARFEALVCVSDGCWIVDRNVDGTWFTREHVPRPKKGEKPPPNPERIIVT